jgi:5-methyltetrahydrofolate--homocysteine methyltransferase
MPEADGLDEGAVRVTEIPGGLSRLLQEGDDAGLRDLTREALARGVAPRDILSALLAGMAVVGERFRDHEIFLPDVLLSARAMHAATAVLEPLLRGDGAPAQAKVVLGTVAGDLHDIGKNLVGIMLQGAGFEVIDLGTDVRPERFVEAAVDSGARVIGLSALLTTTMMNMQEVVELVRQRGHMGRIHTIVGGAPVTEAFAREIGADAYGFDAASAAQRVRALLDLA